MYLEKGPQLGQREAIRAIRALGSALEHMTRGSDQRIELELALFGLSEPPQQPQAVPVQPRPVLQLNPQRRSRLPRQLLCSPLQALRLPSRQYRPFLWCSLQRNRNL